MECVTQTIAKVKDKFQTVLQRKITQQITEHGGKEEDCCLSPKACRGRESRRVAVVAEDEEG